MSVRVVAKHERIVAVEDVVDAEGKVEVSNLAPNLIVEAGIPADERRHLIVV